MLSLLSSYFVISFPLSGGHFRGESETDTLFLFYTSFAWTYWAHLSFYHFGFDYATDDCGIFWRNIRRTQDFCVAGFRVFAANIRIFH